MNKYVATVRVKGQTLKTAVFAESSLHARLILEYQFGVGKVIGYPTKFTRADEEYTPFEEAVRIFETIKPPSPEQARIDALKRQKDIATKNLKAERDRQKIAKAQQQLRQVTTPKPLRTV